MENSLNLKDKKVFIVGDSTVCDYRPNLDNYYLQRYGYGTQIFNYLNLNNENQVVNLALSGRSSLSYLTETNYKKLEAEIGDGDFLIIGFGHNDEKSDDPLRFTDPAADYRTPKTFKGTSFQYNLYENYIKLAKTHGATPILCTPIVRYADDGLYDGKRESHVTDDGDYAAAIKMLAADTNTAVVDLTKITRDYYMAHNFAAKKLHAFTTYTGKKPNEIPDGMDKTHINQYGAKIISYLLLTNLPESCSLKSYVKVDAKMPKDKDYSAAINSEYIKPNYESFNPINHSENYLDTVSGAIWFRTAFGTLGQDKVNDYDITYCSGKFTVKTGQGSEFSPTQDGFGAAFIQIDESKNFFITAKATPIAYTDTKSNKNAFGLMLRDDIYIDKKDTKITSNFVSASITVNGKTNMSRTVNNSLEFDKILPFNLNADYELSITRVGQVVYTTIKQGRTIVSTKFTDISFVGVDNTKIYLCMFANGGLTVEFSDINFKITGESQGS